MSLVTKLLIHMAGTLETSMVRMWRENQLNLDKGHFFPNLFTDIKVFYRVQL